jgi:hypothetical protein
MGDLRDLPVVGEVVAVFGIGLDLLLNSGEIVLSLIPMLLANLISVLPLVTTLDSLGEQLAWLPTVPNWLTTLALAALLTTSLLRLIKKLK